MLDSQFISLVQVLADPLTRLRLSHQTEGSQGSLMLVILSAVLLSWSRRQHAATVRKVARPRDPPATARPSSLVSILETQLQSEASTDRMEGVTVSRSDCQVVSLQYLTSRIQSYTSIYTTIINGKNGKNMSLRWQEPTFTAFSQTKSLVEWSSRVEQVRSGIARRAASEVCTHPTSVGTEQAAHGKEREPTKAPGVRIAILINPTSTFEETYHIAMSVADRINAKPAVTLGSG